MLFLKQMNYHTPVLLEETMSLMNLKEGDIVFDGTFGFGGHSREILDRIGKEGRLIATEQDEDVFNISSKDKSFATENVVIENDNFVNIDKILKKLDINKVDKILLDLGVSSYHFDAIGKGFSLSKDEPLDMRMSTSSGVSAADLINGLSQKELADLFFSLSQERFSRQIAKAIVEERKKERILTTSRLVSVIESVKRREGKIHPATKVFQALRIAVNDELNVLEQFLDKLPSILKNEGIAAIISFHSGEDRIVKNKFKELKSQSYGEILTKKPITASEDEQQLNPRSRSAKLRAFRRD